MNRGQSPPLGATNRGQLPPLGATNRGQSPPLGATNSSESDMRLERRPLRPANTFTHRTQQAATGSQLAVNDATGSQMAANGATGSKLAANAAATGSKLAANTVTGSQLAANATTGSKLASRINRLIFLLWTRWILFKLYLRRWHILLSIRRVTWELQLLYLYVIIRQYIPRDFNMLRAHLYLVYLRLNLFCVDVALLCHGLLVWLGLADWRLWRRWLLAAVLPC